VKIRQRNKVGERVKQEKHCASGCYIVYTLIAYVGSVPLSSSV